MVGAVARASGCPMCSEPNHLLAQSPLGPLPPAHCMPCFLRDAFDQFPGCVKRSRTLLGRLPSSFVGRRSGLLVGSHLLGQAHPEGALHPAYVGDLTLFEALKEGGVLTIARVCNHHLRWHTPLP